MTRKIIGLVGLIGSGKGTVSSYLENTHQFRCESFAGHLKDAVSIVFGWPRKLLEGDTDYSRNWREEVDGWWSKRLDIPHLTPRWVLQHWGTDVLRYGFHDDIWIASLEYKLLGEFNFNIVISDVRFPNEIKMISNLGGEVWRVERSVLPEWATVDHENFDDLKRHMTKYYPTVHASEWSWIISKYNRLLPNDGDINDLHNTVDKCLNN